MSVARLGRILLLLSPALLLFAAVAFVILKPGAPPADGTPADVPSGEGKLVVLVVFDQMRGDYLERWKHLYGADGFERMKRDGAWFSNVRLAYSASSTGPGHASLLTGTTPSVHGIVENKWFDRTRGKLVAAGTEDGIERVPYFETAVRDRWPGMSPRRLLSPTVGDALKAQAKGRTVSLSLKERAAVLMGGQDTNGAYCFDSNAGEFHTSALYRKAMPAWADDFERSRAVYRWSDKTWNKIGPASAYDALGPDDAPGEGGRHAFPHSLAPAAPAYFTSLEASAFGNELLWDFAKAAIAGERLGRGETKDLLCLSFSTNDIVGHAYGPDSHEVLDVTLRSDRQIAEMVAHLDEIVGKDRWSLVVTADHGICPLPEASVKVHPEARRIHPNEFLGGLDAHLDKVFGQIDGVPGQWLERDASFSVCYPWLYLNRRLIDAFGLKQSEVEAVAASWLRERPVAVTVFTRSEIEKGEYRTPEEQRLGPLVKLSFHPERSGDIAVIVPPFCLLGDAFTQGTDHGTPHDYDRHVPVLAFGAGVPKLGERKDAASSLIVAPLLSRLLGIDPPAMAKEPLPEVLKAAK